MVEDRTILRHPEKRNKASNPILRKPECIRVKAPIGKTYTETKNLIKKLNLKTVCEEASCPNIGECWENKHATFMIMGDTCTRAWSFCNVKTGIPKPLDINEPGNVAISVMSLELQHVVITSVDRDDLEDGGAQHFAKVIRAIRTSCPNTTIEILTPDFKNKPDAINILKLDPPDVFNHNLETVPRLYPTIRPGARYFTSLKLLSDIKIIDPNIFTKSGLMVGIGETREEILQVMDDLRSANVDFLTIGQYLQPTTKHAPISKFITPNEFEAYASLARGKGFLMVSASPLTRSSYHADTDFKKLKMARQENQLDMKN